MNLCCSRIGEIIRLTLIKNKKQQKVKIKKTVAQNDDKKLFENKDEIFNTKNEETDADEVIYINHAGLVIAAPYLSRFFEINGILINGELNNINKAIHLTGLVASGQEELPEYELVLPKIICGHPLEATVEPMDGFSEKERDSCREMLEAVIKNWGSLGNTSVEGLREAFFEREGKLTPKVQGGWKLQVEQKAFDILLDGLPWSISYIKLPWMEGPLEVEWV